MGTIVVFKQELGIYPWTIHMLNSSLRKKRRFICIQLVLCRNTIKPWRFVQGQLLKKWCQGDNRTHVTKSFSPFTIFEQFAFALKFFTVLNIFLPFRIFEQLALALKFFTALNIFFSIDFCAACTCPENQSLPWNFSLYLNIFYHSGFLSNFRLPWNFSNGGPQPPAYASMHLGSELGCSYLFVSVWCAAPYLDKIVRVVVAKWMWFYQWCGEINELLKKFRLTLFTEAVPRIYPVPHH